MKKQITILSVNTSDKKGTKKTPVEYITLDKNGIINDAHSGIWHRQVSLIDETSINKFSNEMGSHLNYGVLAENITTIGLDFRKLNILDEFFNDNIRLQVSQIGKKCHGTGCAIFKETGDCVMPKEGIFSKVLKEGILKPGDILSYKQKNISILLLSLIECVNGKNKSCDAISSNIMNDTSVYFNSQNIPFKIRQKRLSDKKNLLIQSFLEESSGEFDIILIISCTDKETSDIKLETISDYHHASMVEILEIMNFRSNKTSPNHLLKNSKVVAIEKTLVLKLNITKSSDSMNFGEIFEILLPSLYLLHGINP